MSGFAWVTLATNDSYSLGALVLAHSLRQTGTTHQLAVLVTPGVTKAMREKLAGVFNVVQEVNVLDSKDEANLRLLKRPELGITFTKLHCWRLTQFDKCVFLDADTLVLKNVDELFERDELSAAPDVGWPDCFNSGVFVYRPSNETYEKLIAFALEKGSFDGGDQGLLNLYFSDWAHKDINKHLPFIYNMCSTACYSYLPAFKQYGTDVKVVHFIGASKPWLQYFNTESKQVQPSSDMQHLKSVLQVWWDLFCTLIHPNLSSEMSWSSTEISNLLERPGFSFDHAPDYRDVWDPWEEYDNIPESSSVHNLESHCTNAPCINVPIITSTSSYTPPPSPSSTHSLPAQLHANTPPCQSPKLAISPICVPPCESPVHSISNDSENSELPIECAATSIITKENRIDSDSDDGGLAGAFAQFTLGSPRSPTQNDLEDHLRKQGWEVGNIDYMGRDSFENIWSKICETLATAPQQEKEATPVPEKKSTTEKVEPPAAEDVPSLAEATDAAKAKENIAEIIIAQLTEPVELAAVAIAAPPLDIAETVEIPKEESLITEAAKPAEVEQPTETAKLAESEKTVEAEKPAEITKPVDAPVTVPKVESVELTAVPVDATIKHTESPKIETPAETTKVEAPTTAEAPKVESPVEVAKTDTAVESPKVESPAEIVVETPKAEAVAEAATVEPAKVEEVKIETPKVEEAKIDAPNIEEVKIEAPKAEEVKIEASKGEDVKIESPVTESVEASKVEVPVESPKTEVAPEAPKVDDVKIEASKVDEVKTESPVTDSAEAPKGETTKVDVPAEAAKVETPIVETQAAAPQIEAAKTPVIEGTIEATKTVEPAAEAPKIEAAVEVPKIESAVEEPKVEAVVEAPKSEDVKIEASVETPIVETVPAPSETILETPKVECPQLATEVPKVEPVPETKVETTEIKPEEPVKSEAIAADAKTTATAPVAEVEPIKAETPKVESVTAESIPKVEPESAIKIETAPADSTKVETDAPKEEPKSEAKLDAAPKEEVKLDAPKEEPKVDVKLDAPKEEPQAAPKEEVKLDAPKEEPKSASKEEVKLDATKEEPKTAPTQEVKLDAPKEEPKSAPKEEVKLDAPKEEVKVDAPKEAIKPEEVTREKSAEPKEVAAAAPVVPSDIPTQAQEVAAVAVCAKTEETPKACAECPKQEKCADCPKQGSPEETKVVKKCPKKKGVKECPKQDCEKKEASKSPTPEVAEVATEEAAATSGGPQAPTPPPRKSSGGKKTKPKK